MQNILQDSTDIIQTFLLTWPHTWMNALRLDCIHSLERPWMISNKQKGWVGWLLKLSKGQDVLSTAAVSMAACLLASKSNDNTRGGHCLHIPTKWALSLLKLTLSSQVPQHHSFSLMSPQLQLHLVFSPLSSLLMDPTGWAIETSPLVCYIVLKKTQTKWHWKSVLRNPETRSCTLEWMLWDWIAFTAWLEGPTSGCHAKWGNGGNDEPSKLWIKANDIGMSSSWDFAKHCIP
jgi:hypothetical protein